MPDKREILESIYRGFYNLDNLPPEIYLNNTSKLITAINKGLGRKLSDISILDDDYEMISGFYENANKFAGSKLYHQVNDTKNFIKNSTGTRRLIDAFMKDALQIDELYNKTWLSVEVDAFTKRADKAREWKQFTRERDIFPLLQFSTVGDSRVRPEHAALDGIIKPVNDTFWDTYAPPLAYRCRCVLNQLEDGRITPDSEYDEREILAEVEPTFRSNPGKTNKIFNETGKYKHPYFKVPKEKLNNNFGFGTIKSIQ